MYFLGTGGSLGAFTLGDVLILVAAVARALHVTFMHRLTAGRSSDSMQLTFVQMATCGGVFLALSSFWGSSTADYLATLSASSWIQLLYLVVICTVFPFFIQMWAVRKTSPTRVSLLLGTEPVWAAVIGVTLTGTGSDHRGARNRARFGGDPVGPANRGTSAERAISHTVEPSRRPRSQERPRGTRSVVLN